MIHYSHVLQFYPSFDALLIGGAGGRGSIRVPHNQFVWLYIYLSRYSVLVGKQAHFSLFFRTPFWYDYVEE